MMRPALILTVALLPMATGCSGLMPEENIRPKGVDLYVAGVQANQAGDTKLAQSRFEQATSVNPSLRMPHALLGDIYRSQGEYDRAQEQYQVLTTLDPYDSENYYRLGITYQFVDKVQDAITSYLRALDLKPRDMRSCMNLGLCYLSLGQSDEAIKYLRQATALSPTWADAWTNLGVALDAKGDLTGAEQAYKRALELNRNQNIALLNLGANLIRQGKGAQAVSVMEEAIKRTDSAPARTRYGHALALAKRFSDALTQFQVALKLDSRYYPAYNEQGSTLVAQYEQGLELDDTLRQQALNAWQQSLNIYPNQPPVRQAVKRWNGGRLFGESTGRTP